MAVIAYHLGFLRGGFLGVDLFFVLSGFLLTGLAVTEIDHTGTLGLRSFWGRRIRRLAPALLLMVPVVIAAALILDWPTDERGALAIDGIATLTWWANWRQLLAPGGGYWSEVPSLFRHAWSLSIEEQFYLLWPLVLTGCTALALRGRRHVRFVVAGVAGALALASASWALILAHRLPEADLARVYLGSDTRAVAPLIGCVAGALWWDRSPSGFTRGLGWLASAGLVVMTVVVEVDASSTYRVPMLTLAALLAAVAILGATSWERIDPVSRWLGQRSYGLYLWSWPIQVLFQHWRPSAGRGLVAAVTVPLSMAVAEMSWRLVENPVQRSRAWASGVAMRRVAASVGLVVMGVVAAAAVSTATEKAPHEAMTDAEMTEAALAPPPSLPSLPPLPAPSSTIWGEEPTPDVPDERVMVVGDSIAFSFARYADEIGPVDGVASIDNRGVPFCGVLSTVRVDPEQCVKVDEAMEIGLSGSPDVILWIPGGWEWGGVPLPEGRVETLTDEMAMAIQDRILQVAEDGDRIGARMVILEWSCPGPEDRDSRKNPDYVRWINDTIGRTVHEGQARGLNVELGAPPPDVCQGGSSGTPTADKNLATKNEVHASGPEGAEWIWQNWLGPVIRATR